MKTKYIIVAIIIAAFSFGSCSTKENFDLKLTIVPESGNSAISLNNMNTASEIIRKRLNNSFGIPLQNLKAEVTENQILLTIPGAESDKIPSIKETVTNFTRFEFWETYENKELIGSLTAANNLLKEMKVATNVKSNNAIEEFTAQNPLYGLLRPRVSEKGEALPSCMIGLAGGKDTTLVMRYMRMPEIKALLPDDLKLMWSMNTYKYDPSKTLFELHAIKVTASDGRAPLDGSVITSAKAVPGRDSKSDIKIDLSMSSEGAARWASITKESIGRCITVVIDGYVRSYPRVQAEITGGNTEITGNFTLEEANELVSILKSGELPFKLKITDQQIIKR